MAPMLAFALPARVRPAYPPWVLLPGRSAIDYSPRHNDEPRNLLGPPRTIAR